MVLSPLFSRFVSECSTTWYTSTLRLRRSAVAETPNTSSDRTSCVSALPLTCTSWPSFAGSTLSA